MKYRTLWLIMFFFFMLGVNKVSALHDVYVNSYGVEIEYDLYERLCNLYSKDYMEFITEERYEELNSLNLSDFEVKEFVDIPLIQPFSALWETEYKIIKIVKSGNKITLILTWKKMPAVRSYDVMAVRFDGITLNGAITSKQVVTSNGIKTANVGSEKTFLQGFGVSFLLPSGTITGLEEQVEFQFKGSGFVYGTYQHAQQSLSLADSMNYSLSSTGLGRVLQFASSTISNKYDNMTGVDMTV